ncbi:MAG: type III pantothenate kinase [Candidatus Omnitrophica bacterium]|nr:type III pantothenate kinase [Candidatus Omnitrophota bacterium]
MILIDVGNTRIHFAYARGDTITRRAYLDTQDADTSSIRRVFDRFPKGKVLICSVVPNVTRLFPRKKNNTLVVGKDVAVPIRCRYNQKQVGQDRLLLAFGAGQCYRDARIIIDFGTAITFDFLSSKGEYLGGFIFPGIEISTKALARCALLPHIRLNAKNMKRKYSIARTTEESISRGVCEGVIAMINSWIESYAARLIGQTRIRKGQVILTGGCAGMIRKRFTFPYRYDPDLIFRGMIRLVSPVR